MPDEKLIIDRPAAATGGPGVLVLGGKTFVVRHPTPADFFAAFDYARSLAAAEVRSPLAAIAADLDKLPAEFRAEAVREAIAQTKGEATPEPTREAVERKFESHDGVCWFVWWLAKANHPDLTLDAVKALSPPAERFALQAALMAATKLEEKGEKKVSTGSPPSSASSPGSTGTSSTATA